MSQQKKRPTVTITVHNHAMVVDAEECTFLIANISEERQPQLVERLQAIPGLVNVRIEDAVIIAGIDELKLEQIDEDEDEDFDGPPEVVAAQLFPGYRQVEGVVREVIGKVVVRKHREDPDEGKSIVELIWGPDWQDNVALTEEEREVLG